MYFFGELIPPYVDKLGRGAHLRPTDSDNTLYQEEAKCYRNQQALGSKASIVASLTTIRRERYVAYVVVFDFPYRHAPLR